MNSYYTITLSDGSVLKSTDINWQDYSRKTKVTRFGKSFVVYSSVVPISSITVVHNGLEKVLTVPSDCQVYQYVTARTLFSLDNRKEETLGRSVGLVKNGIVVEEYNLSRETNEITGFKL